MEPSDTPTIITPGTNNVIIPKGYIKDDITILGDPNLIAANILQGKNIFGILGSASSGTNFATGSTPNAVLLNDIKSPSNVSKVVSMNLNFNPRYVFCYVHSLKVASSTSSSWTGAQGSFFVSNVAGCNITRTTSSSNYSMSFSISGVNASSFTLNISCYSGSYYSAAIGGYNWYAIG